MICFIRYDKVESNNTKCFVSEVDQSAHGPRLGFLTDSKYKMKSTKAEWLDEMESAWGDGNDDEENALQPNKPKQVYYEIVPDGPITGAIWENGRWEHTGGFNKRRRFEIEEDDNHTNLLANPRKKQRFLMKVEHSEIEHLTRRIKRNKPPRNLNPVALLQATELKNKFDRRSKSSNTATVEHPEGFDAAMNVLDLAGNFKISNTFEELPISQYVKHSLQRKGLTFLTDIQKAAIPHALVGRDILGAAKTGSGKTLAFVIPVIENLYRKAWNRELGLGALLLAPTRELALQIFKS